MCHPSINSNLRLDIFGKTTENSSKLKSAFQLVMTMAWIAFVAYDFKSRHFRFIQTNDKKLELLQ